MTRPKVLVTASFDDSAAAAAADHLDLVTVPQDMDGVSIADMGVDAQLSEAEVIIAELDRVDTATLAKASKLRLVVSCRANPVNVDLDACSSRGIPVATTPGRNANVTADFSFALILATVRHLSVGERWMREGNWRKDHPFEPYETFQGIGLAGRTLGILGGGAVGLRVARRAVGFDMNVLVYDPYLGADRMDSAIKLCDLDEIFAQSDVVSIHVPVMESTIGLVGAHELSLMKPDSYLVNAARAVIIDQDALLEVLRQKKIAGAGFDVHYDEPLPRDSEMYTFDNVVLTPHIAGASNDVVREHSRMAIDAVRAWYEGRDIAHVANRDRVF